MICFIGGWRATSARTRTGFSLRLWSAPSRSTPDRIVRILLDRRHESAWVGLVVNYDRIGPDGREKLRARLDMLRAGIATALAGSDPRARENALALLADVPSPRLAYLVADALRDSPPRVVAAAAETLQRTAVHVLDAVDANSGVQVSAQDRAVFVEALGEALRTFQRHGQIEVLETCLWFAKELDAQLWDALTSHSSRCGYVVERHLRDWDSPRLAGFLLLALTRSTWSRVARGLLTSWAGVPELIAVLRNSDLLADPQVCKSLSCIQRPRWYLVADSVLADLPTDVRAVLPYWVCHLGFSDQERIRCLDRWQSSALPEVHRAAVYALAGCDVPAAVRILAGVAGRSCPMQRFARWYVVGQRWRVKCALWAQYSTMEQDAGTTDSLSTEATR